MLWQKCATPLYVGPEDYAAVSHLYPYGLWGYPQLADGLSHFVAEHMGNWPPGAQMTGMSDHNGYGRQWGIILVRHYEQQGWHIAAHFGHRLHFEKWWKRRLWWARKHHDKYNNHALREPRTLGSLCAPA